MEQGVRVSELPQGQVSRGEGGESARCAKLQTKDQHKDNGYARAKLYKMEVGIKDIL